MEHLNRIICGRSLHIFLKVFKNENNLNKGIVLNSGYALVIPCKNNGHARVLSGRTNQARLKTIPLFSNYTTSISQFDFLNSPLYTIPVI